MQANHLDKRLCLAGYHNILDVRVCRWPLALFADRHIFNVEETQCGAECVLHALLQDTNALATFLCGVLLMASFRKR